MYYGTWSHCQTGNETTAAIMWANLNGRYEGEKKKEKEKREAMQKMFVFERHN